MNATDTLTDQDERRKQLIAQIPADNPSRPAAAKMPRVDSTELGRNVSNTLSALPGIAPMLTAGRALAGASAAEPVIAGAAGRLASLFAPAAPYAPVVGGGAALAVASRPPAPPFSPTPQQQPAAAAAPAQPAAPVVQQPAGPVATLATLPAAAAIPAPAQAGSIVKTILNPDGTPGKRLAWGAGATPMASLGAASFPLQQSDGTIIAGSTQDQDRSQATARLASGVVDPREAIATGLQQQLAHQQAVIQAAAEAATRYAGGSQKAFTNIFHAALSAGGQNNFGATQGQGAVAQLQNNVAAGHLNLETQSKAPVINAQTAYTSAKTPQAKASAEEQLRVLQGKYEKEAPELFATTALPGSTDALGNKTPGGAIVTNKRDGTTKIIYGNELAPKTEPLPAKDKLVKGTTYDTPRGKAKWDGSQFLPV